MAAVIEVKYFNTFILKKTNSDGSSQDPDAPMWNGSFGIPESIGGYPRSTPRQANNSSDGNWCLEESRIRGGYNNTSTDYGAKAYLVEDEPNQSTRVNTLIYSGIFNSRTGINNTNVFSIGEEITKSLDPANGSIQKLYAEDTNLNIFQELKVSKALIDKDAIYSAEGGGTSVSAIMTVIGQIVPYLGEYGIGTNPESFAIYGYNKYFSDSNKNVILRLSRSGIDEISSAGMKDYFRDELNRIKVSSNPGVVLGGWDIYTSQYIVNTKQNISITSGNNGIDKYNTLAFDDKINGWTSFFDYNPDQIVSIRNQMYTTKNAGLWLHNSQEDRNSQATLQGAVSNSIQIRVDNVTGNITLGDLVKGLNIAPGTVVLSINIQATFVELILNRPVTLQDNVSLSFIANLRNNFYGINYPSSVTFVFNDNPDLSKTFKTIEYEGFNGWRVDSFVSDSTGRDTYINSLEFTSTIDITSQVYSYDEGAYDASGQTYPNTLSGNIFRAGFYRKENKYYANLLNTSPPTKYAVHFGEQMTGIKGFYAVVTMSTDSSTDLGGEKQLFQVGTEYITNNGY